MSKEPHDYGNPVGKSAAEVEQDLGLARWCLYCGNKTLKDVGDAVFPGHGRQYGTEEEIRRLRCDLEIVR